MRIGLKGWRWRNYRKEEGVEAGLILRHCKRLPQSRSKVTPTERRDDSGEWSSRAPVLCRLGALLCRQCATCARCQQEALCRPYGQRLVTLLRDARQQHTARGRGAECSYESHRIADRQCEVVGVQIRRRTEMHIHFTGCSLHQDMSSIRMRGVCRIVDYRPDERYFSSCVVRYRS